VLREQRRVQAEQRLRVGPAWEDSGLVFAREDGRAPNPKLVSKRFIDIARAAGFEGLRFHDLRHTAATLMLHAGVNPKLAAARLGHANANITLATYSHVQPDLEEHVAEVLDVLLDPHLGSTP
jgi:integrase